MKTVKAIVSAVLICRFTDMQIRISRKIVTSLRIAFFFSLIYIFAYLPTRTFANNIYIQNVNYASPPNLTFQISWENSWYTTSTPNNWDAVWVFVKYQPCGSGTPASPPWSHASVSTTSTDHTVSCSGSCAPISLQVDAVTDGKGVFIRGNNLAAGFTGLWNVSLKITGTAATSCNLSNSCNWKVFGIEMVYIPGGSSFSVGDGSGTTVNPLNDGTGPPGAPVTISGAGGPINIYPGPVSVPAAFSKGYNAFYCMKHEISQEEYAGFLNTLTFEQQKTRVRQSPDSIYNFWVLTPSPSGGPYNRQGIKMSQQGIGPSFVPATYGLDLNNDLSYNGAMDGLHVACNYLSWQDVCAFLDWAALRPMTELEYEKVCRGTAVVVTDEYPWGTSTDLTSGTSSMLANAGRVSEVVDTAVACSQFPTAWCNGLVVYNGVAGQGPVRVGQAARNTTTRVNAGASYYGVLDMAGNVREQVVPITFTGYTGSLGDGALSTDTLYRGNATNTDWPGIDGTASRGITGATGSGSKGGCWYTQAAAVVELRTSDRTSIATPMSNRDSEYGGRGVR